MNKLKYLAAPLLFAASTSVMAIDVNIDNECEIDLNANLTITPEHILIKEDDETLIDIYQDQMVFVRGELVDLNASDTALVQEYASTLRNSVPEITAIALTAVEAAFEGINAGLGDLGNMDGIRDAFDEVKYQIEYSYEQANGYYSFTDGEFTLGQNNQDIEHAIEGVMEEIMPSLIGNLLTQVGTAMASGDADFSSFDDLGERIETEVEARTAVIEEKAYAFCKKLEKANDLETQLIAKNPELKDLDLLQMSVSSKAK